MKHKRLFVCLGGLAVLLLAEALLRPDLIGTRPFKDLVPEDIQSVQLELFPPDLSIQLTREEIDRLIPLLNQVVIYRRDDSWRECSGQLCLFTLTKTDGAVVTAGAYNPAFIIDGVGWRTKYEPCEALNHFANTLRS